ncbi:hypothetical protein BO95DRAFT_358433, partial [Aspergillus brunneoviolaceus CBS 621.78]
RVWKTGLPVRSAVLKPHAGRLVVGWVTTSESLLLYVFALILYFQKQSWIIGYQSTLDTCNTRRGLLGTLWLVSSGPG